MERWGSIVQVSSPGTHGHPGHPGPGGDTRATIRRRTSKASLRRSNCQPHPARQVVLAVMNGSVRGVSLIVNTHGVEYTPAGFEGEKVETQTPNNGSVRHPARKRGSLGEIAGTKMRASAPAIGLLSSILERPQLTQVVKDKAEFVVLPSV